MSTLALVGIGIVSMVVLVVAVHIAGRIFWKKRQKNQKISLLKISPNRNSEKNPGVAEYMFSALHGIYHEYSWWEKFLGKIEESISFEMVHQNGNIFFYARVPEHLTEFISGQIYATYPQVEIVETDDYSQKFLENSSHAMGEIVLGESSLWPIKRHSQFEDKTSMTAYDPISGLILPLTQGMNTGDIAGIQFSVRPFDDDIFRYRAKKALQILSAGIYSYDWSKDGFQKWFLTFGFWNRLKSLPMRAWYFVMRGGSKGTDEEQSVNIDVDQKTVHERENDIAAAQDKMSRMVFETEIKIFYSSQKKTPNGRLNQKLKEMASPFKQFNIPYLNTLEFSGESYSNEKFLEKISRNFVTDNQQIILNTEELSTLFHMPNQTVTIPQIDWISSRKISPVSEIPRFPEENLTLLGETNFRGKNIKFGIRPDDRRRHMYIVGKTGMGKSTLLENMIFSDIQSGKGVAVIDPHGDLAEASLSFVPKSRTNDVILFDPADREFPISFNMLECANLGQKDLVASGVLGVFKKMFADSWGPRLEHILRNTLLALIEAGNQSLLGILRMLADKKYRAEIVAQVKDPVVLSFWNDEFGAWQPKQVTEAVAPIQNKVGQFLSSSLVRNILGQTKSSFDVRHAMDNGKIIIVNLSKGKIGEDVSALLGAMFITKFQIDVMSRADIAEKDRKDFYLYVDEFQNFATGSFGTILSEARKYKLNLTVANQYLAQMEDEVKDAIFGNVGSMMSFQVGYDDAKYLSDQFGGEDFITPEDIGTLPKYQIYARVMMNGMPSPVFSANTLAPPKHTPSEKQLQKVIKVAREKYSTPRAKVEERILKWANS